MDCVIHSSLKSNLLPLSLILSICIITTTSSSDFNVTTLTFQDSYSPLFSEFNIQRSPDDKTVRLLLNRFSGSGIISSDYYNYGFFSASIKMPSEHTAGIVVAFYTSNVDTFERNHDELDIEFLGNIKGKPWRFQTNMYGNGSVSRGREERYRMWFDPSNDSYRYSILWTPKKHNILRGQNPDKRSGEERSHERGVPIEADVCLRHHMGCFHMGYRWRQKRVDYKHDPFIAEFRDLVLEGCIVDPIDQILSSNCTDSITRLIANYSTIASEGRKSMKWLREKYMYYSYCYDNIRYPVPPPECVIVPSERDSFLTSGKLREKMKFHGSNRHHRRGGKAAKRRSKEAVM